MSDQPARDRIATDLGTSFLVEAGAGSGKTTALVARLVAHVREGTPLETIAAVTFTRKAANELRERLQNGLEAEARGLPDGDGRRRVLAALDDLDRGFIGTIHAFAGRLLRDRPLEAGLDPTFRELDEEEWPALTEAFFRDWLDGGRLRDDPDLAALGQLGIDAAELLPAFQVVVDNPDVAFVAEPRPLPAVAACRTKLLATLDAADALMPATEPEKGWDDLQLRVRHLRFLRSIHDWNQPALFFRALAAFVGGRRAVTQNRWGETREAKAAAKALGAAVEAFVEETGGPALTRWREHRYAPVQAFLRRGADDFGQYRAATGQLGFQDLLTRAAALLRESPPARAALAGRFRHLLVDEFQDTDPLQAELCFLLASEPAEGTDWRTVRPRAGALFVVGDPKQSIYRFRRADILTYEFVKRRLAACGEVLGLTRNFRSTTAIGAFVNAHFQGAFPAAASDVQAAFSPLDCQRAPAPDEGVRTLVTIAERNKGAIARENAEGIAGWIESRIAAGARPGEFMVITYHTHGIEAVARALAERNVPARTVGARLPQETELRELVLVLQALADPENAVLVTAVLEGIFFGLTPGDLYEARRAGQAFALDRPPAGRGPVAGALATLHEWWQLARLHPPDVLLDLLADRTGLLAWSASQALGDGRAGALLRLGDLLRQEAGPVVFDLPSAIVRLEAALARAGDDAPLRAGLTNAVQVLNLHKAKGLEAETVILAVPAALSSHDPTLHVRRGDDGRALGGMVVASGDAVLAQPVGWAEQAAEEERFLAAERDRLLYVATTRAKRTLVVSQYGGPRAPADPGQADVSGWRPLHPALASAEPLALELRAVPGRKALERSGVEVESEASAADAWRAEAARPGWRREAVTRSSREASAEERDLEVWPRPPGGRGRAWGRAVHRVLEAAGRGRRGESLAAFTRAVAADEALPPADAARLAAVLEAFLAGPEWRALEGQEARFEFPMMRRTEGPGGALLEEGIADVLLLGAAAGEVLDWKTGGPGVTEDPAYQRQVRAYAAMVEARSGRGLTSRIVRVGGEA